MEGASAARSFALCREALVQLAARPLPKPERGYWVYGAGGFGRSLARELMRLGQPVLGFIDRKGRQLRTVEGLRCLHPDDVDDSDLRGTDYAHGLMNHYGPSSDVVEWAARRNFARLVFPADFFRLPGFRLSNYWLADPAETIAQLDRIEDFHDSLDDDESRRLLRSLLVYRLSSDPRLHPDVAASDVYAPAFLPIFERPITFIDGGAFTGDTLEALVSKGVDVSDWVAFEPDVANAAALQQTADKHRDRLSCFTLLQAGLSDRSGVVRFASEGSQSSRVLSPEDVVGQNSGTITEIAVLRFDDAVRRSGDVYVKLDIEGAERGALRGMAKLLRQRPVLAVSIYHQPSDLWEIPALVQELYRRPRMRIGLHCHHGFDTVLYVMP